MLLNIVSIMSGKQSGATLIEAVVALFIFSVGILGVAAIQASTLVRGDDVKQRSLAIWKAQELADRIRATRTVDNPAGLVANYRAALGNNVAAIDSYTVRGSYSCPNDAPTLCDDAEGAAAGSCSTDEIITFDIWSVICDPRTGVSDANISAQDGINKLKDLDIAMRAGGAAGENFIYFSWLSRNADNNEAFRPGAGEAASTTETLLCGEIRNVDTRLETYCLRFF